MFDPNSRYFGRTIKRLAVANPAGEPREIRYVERRFLPSVDASATLAEYVVIQGDRLDNLTARFLGDPELFWRVADANEAMRPEELTDDPGRRITIPLPQ